MKNNIKNYPNYNVDKNGVITNIITNKIIKHQMDKDGYYRVNLYNKGQHTKQFVHRLVAMAYLPNIKNLPQVNHKDGNKENNQVDNLEWVTARENVVHSYKVGLKRGIGACHIGEKNTNSKLKEIDVLMIKKRKNNKEKIRDVYADYKDQITFKGFEQIWFGYTWKHLIEKVEG